MSTYGPTIDAAGITAPSYADILAGLIADYKNIFGSDIYLGADSQDYEFLALQASAIHDSNQSVIAAFNSFAPGFAQGAGLSSLVKINGIRRKSPSYSTVTVTLTGVANTAVNGGMIADDQGNKWDVADCVIGIGGTVDATATAQEIGAIAAAPDTLVNILNPTRGWQEVTNAAAATAGQPVETDAELRQRQARSVARPASTLVEAISSAVGDVAGVGRYFVYENDTGATDADGIPAHSIAVVAEGGDAQDIAEAIALVKPPGIQTYGSTTRTVIDSRGVPRDIHLFVLVDVALKVEVTILALAGYVTTTGDLIQAAVAGFIGGAGDVMGLDLGEDSYLARLYAPAGLQGEAAQAATGLTQAQLDVLAKTYKVTLLRQAKVADAFAAADVAIAFDEAASCLAANVTLLP